MDNTSILKHCGKYHIIAAFGTSFLFAAIFNYKLIISLSLTYMITGVIIGILDKKIKNVPSSTEGFLIETSLPISNNIFGYYIFDWDLKYLCAPMK